MILRGRSENQNCLKPGDPRFRAGADLCCALRPHAASDGDIGRPARLLLPVSLQLYRHRPARLLHPVQDAAALKNWRDEPIDMSFFLKVYSGFKQFRERKNVPDPLFKGSGTVFCPTVNVACVPYRLIFFPRVDFRYHSRSKFIG